MAFQGLRGANPSCKLLKDYYLWESGGEHTGNLYANLVISSVRLNLFPNKKLEVLDLLHFTD